MSTVAKIITGVVVVTAIVASIIIWRVIAGSNDKQLRTVTTTLRSVYQDVTFTGQLKSSQDVKLGFEVAGTMQNILVDVGDTVSSGSIRLDPRFPRADRRSRQPVQC